MAKCSYGLSIQKEIPAIKYRIEWRSITTGASGHGDWFDASSKESLLMSVKDCNQRYPTIQHWVACNG